jgi:ABC-2 type transport system ATP-binding protein
MPETVAEAAGLIKRYQGANGSIMALDAVTFDVHAGEIFGLIGADGAGKTTAFQIMAGIMEPSGGTVRMLGQRPRDAREQVGYLTQRFSLYQDLSILENLRYAAGLRRVAAADFETRCARFLEAFGLRGFEERLAGKLSGGMKQKLALSCALISDPRILLLDEPTTGVDPVSRREFWDTLATLAAEGRTIVVATPYLHEAERCHRVALIERGRIHDIDSPPRFRAKVTTAAGRRPTLEDAFVARLEQMRGSQPHPPFPGRRPASGRGEKLLEAAHLEKRFGPFTAVRKFNLTIRRGEVYGLLGANGAGKTTAIKMICGLLAPTRGSITLLGHREGLRGAAVRSRIGYMSQRFTLYDDLSIGENLDFYANLYGLDGEARAARKRWVMEISGLEGQEKLLTGQLPGGWKQRVAFGAAIMHEPDLIFLDEPTSGVDPLARRTMWSMIHDLAARGAGILVVTHYLEEAERCSRIGFMASGEVLLEGSPAEVRASRPGGMLEIETSDVARTRALFPRSSQFGNRVHVSGASADAIRHVLAGNGIQLISIEEVPVSLEDVFLSLIDERRASA